VRRMLKILQCRSSIIVGTTGKIEIPVDIFFTGERTDSGCFDARQQPGSLFVLDGSSKGEICLVHALNSF